MIVLAWCHVHYLCTFHAVQAQTLGASYVSRLTDKSLSLSEQ